MLNDKRFRLVKKKVYVKGSLELVGCGGTFMMVSFFSLLNDTQKGDGGFGFLRSLYDD